ncbi:AarF/ABC1/UbiB kinase family protein [uncultured Roseovarius sp.]|uniref:ABC1 kinase family protein n=1 Tax=uncultured Roseovarius sp. TaxID=293344 RepID=UPI00261082FF|nr:AarF/ABC1/UbiB kinase family protein [uncultured Roseovarius sp.]
MSHRDRPQQSHPVPEGRLGRMLRFGDMTSGIFGDMLAQGARQMARGERPRLPGLLLTPETARRVTRDLGHMRGAAMKLGQILSMETGHILPPEMTTVMATLRADAPHMPPKQLQSVLNAAWGEGWYSRFARFDLRPFAAASIGQVHRAKTHDGRDLAIKVQYPGIRNSIDSDIDNVATLLRVPGLIPRDMDLTPLLRDAKQQLQNEADYHAEARHLQHFNELLQASDVFCLPRLVPELSTADVLAMSYVESQPLDALCDAPQELRDHVAKHLIELVLRELFTFNLMQTDPNLANYRYDPATGRIALLDFGAAMAIRPALAEDFRALLNAALDEDPEQTRAAMLKIGYFSTTTAPRHQELIQRLFETAMAPLRQTAPFDFGTSDLVERLRDMGLAMGSDRELNHVPPPETLFLHRKIGGIYLLATRLKARVALRPMLESFR